jgi:hypothetical protein
LTSEGVVKRLAAKPTGIIPGACDGWGEDWAYRFLGNTEDDWTDAVAPHWQSTMAWVRSCPVVLRMLARLNWTSTASRPKGTGL